MSEETDVRWRFKVIDLPKPHLEGTAYRYGFVAMGIALGAIWENTFVQIMGQRRGSILVFAACSVLMVWQAIYLRMEHKRIQKLSEMVREEMKRRGVPELTDDEAGNGSHEG